MSEYRTFTHRFNINDVSLLLEEAKDIESYAQLRERAVEVLSQPSRARRTEIAGDVKRFLLDYGEKDLNPSKLPLV